MRYYLDIMDSCRYAFAVRPDREETQMKLTELALLAVGLSMDAFAVAI